ncbi:MAG: 2-dehydropantoate 2-reductase [Promethearchaeota archaeon]|nr:MAG: 2-dehydropantoate 2-reductase [Candidatus Lokiarchaeota archaeon]
MKKTIRMGILGAGSVGSLFGGRLAAIESKNFSIEMTFICRKNNAEAIEKNGLVIQFQEKRIQVPNIRAVHNPDVLDGELFDYIFLTTKAYDSACTLKEYRAIVSNCRFLIILQNGIGNEEIVSEFCNQAKIIRCVTTEGAFLLSPGHLLHTGLGYTKIGFPFINIEEEKHAPQRDGIEQLYRLLCLAGFDTTLSQNIINESWEKIFVNIGINPFGALTRLRNGDLLKNEDLKALMADAVIEALKVAEARGLVLPDRDYVSNMFDVAKNTADNQNSMLQDILKKKKTEIEFINGRIVAYAKELGLNVPINALLTVLIERLEASYMKDSSSTLTVI